MKKIINRISSIHAAIYAFVALLMSGLCPVPAFAAAGNFETGFANIKSLADTAGGAIKAVFLVSGLVFLGLGIFKWIERTNQQQPKGPAVVSIVAGVLLLSIWAFAETLAQLMGISMDANFG